MSRTSQQLLDLHESFIIAILPPFAQIFATIQQEVESMDENFITSTITNSQMKKSGYSCKNFLVFSCQSVNTVSCIATSQFLSLSTIKLVALNIKIKRS